MRSTTTTVGMLAALILSWTCVFNARAQQGTEAQTAQPVREASQAAPVESPAPADTTATAAPPQASPPPGEEVMRPTDHGVRLTPGMARAITRAMASEMSRKYKLTPEQQQQLSENYAGRIMRVARQNEEHGQAFCEYTLEAIWASLGSGGPGMKFSPDMAREFGQRAGPVMPAFRELLDGLDEEVKPILSPEDYERFSKELDEPRKVLDRFEEKMHRWADGQAKEGENPFNDLEPPATRPASAPPEKPRTPEVQQAEQMADWTLSSGGVTEWRWFLNHARDHFKFDEQQSEKAQQIFSSYASKAEAIMTPEWKEAVRQNRIKVNLRNQLKGVATIPWMWRLQHEYDMAVKPIHELGWAFRKEILALLTPQQREAALAGIVSGAAQHGLSVDEKDKAALGVAGAGTWSLWRF